MNLGICLTVGEVHLAYKKLMKWPIPEGMTTTEALRSLITTVGEEKVKELQKEWKKEEYKELLT